MPQQMFDVWVITGSRDIEDEDFIHSALDSFADLFGLPDTLVHGCARGVDTIAGEWAKAKKITPAEYPVYKEDWDKHGKKAGILRNAEMAKDVHAEAQAPLCIAFPYLTGQNRGTRNMIEECIQWKGIPTFVYPYDPQQE